MKRILFVAALMAAGFSGVVRAQVPSGGEATVTVQPSYDEFGNTMRIINVPLSTSSLVLISSEAQNAVMQTDTSTSLGILSWRFREIVNMSTCAALALYPDKRFTTFMSSGGVVLSSDSTGGGNGDSFVVPSQTEIWGIWTPSANPGACAAGRGAGGYETYYLATGKK